QELAVELARKNGSALQEANLALAASQICETLQDFDVKELKAKLQEKPEFYAVLVSAISRLSSASVAERKLQLELTKYQDKVAQQREKIQQQIGLSKAGGLTPEILADIEQA